MAQIVWNKLTFPVKTKEEYYELWVYQDERRRRNLAPGRKLSVGTKLKLLSAPTFSYLSLPPYDLSPGSGNIKRLTSSFPRNTVLVLEKSLTKDPAEGYAINAPVWMATIKGRSFVVKLYQACFHKPEWSDRRGCYDFFPEEEQAHREAFAYTALRDLQGSKIPRSYGFYKTILPSKDSVTIHIMEYIPGPTWARLREDEDEAKKYPLTVSMKKQIIEDLVDTGVELEASGVAHMDFIARNIILTTRAWELHPILIDFGQARAVIDGEDKWSARDLIGYARRNTFQILRGPFGDDFVDETVHEILERRGGDSRWAEFLNEMIAEHEYNKAYKLAQSLEPSQDEDEENPWLEVASMLREMGKEERAVPP